MPAIPDKRVCDSCVFFEPYRDSNGDREKEGQCRRYAMRPAESPIQQWPDTSAALWCGEWSDVHPYERQSALDQTMKATRNAQAQMREHFERPDDALGAAVNAIAGEVLRGPSRSRKDPQ